VCIQSVSRVTTALAAKLDMSKIQLHMAECVSKSWKGYETCECALRMGSLTVMMAASRFSSFRQHLRYDSNFAQNIPGPWSLGHRASGSGV